MKQTLFHAADTFLSPVDNPQETFGLSILEAGAYGLPVIASAYDGYRDLLIDGHTGFLVPVTGPENTAAIDMLAPIVFDSESHLLLAQQTAVDVPALAAAIKRCLEEPELAASMGQNARQHVHNCFTWGHTVQKYCQLWESLWQNPVKERTAIASSHPLHTPYARIFTSYCCRVLDGQTRLVWSPTGKAVYNKQENLSLYEGLGTWICPDAVHKLLFFARTARTVDMITQRAVPVLQKKPEEIRFLLNWSLKHDLLERVTSQTKDI